MDVGRQEWKEGAVRLVAEAKNRVADVFDVAA
jgi:hypothetical protein